MVVLLVDPVSGGPSAQNWRRPVPPYDAIAVVCDSADVHEIPLHGLDQRFTEIDAFGDGVILGAARIPRAHPDDESSFLVPVPEEELRLTLNAKVFDGDGNQIGAFYAGDGIEQLLTDPEGRIWISYFDEANYWSRNPDGTCSHRFLVGLARWDDPQPRRGSHRITPATVFSGATVMHSMWVGLWSMPALIPTFRWSSSMRAGCDR
ncbi:hypothetical protein [Nocardia blacklockiae]|uniref:hypothetical protein n=1 Tax=Nocardia blacklockiae TaxID=480036 RepID=UPI001893B2F0|nr:hypothetical protein [Nocardia blacklockiae]MBF6171030.1 hypothetical protein [Nocardia blacklockiae]